MNPPFQALGNPTRDHIRFISAAGCSSLTAMSGVQAQSQTDGCDGAGRAEGLNTVRPALALVLTAQWGEAPP